MRVFFYGLFMDRRLLAKRGIQPAEACVGFVDGFELCIGERATLVRRPDSRAYGVMMDIDPGDLSELYADESVAAYMPEPITVELMDGTKAAATCFNLPSEEVTTVNMGYAEALLDIATRLDFPDSYLDEIRQVQSKRGSAAST